MLVMPLPDSTGTALLTGQAVDVSLTQPGGADVPYRLCLDTSRSTRTEAQLALGPACVGPALGVLGLIRHPDEPAHRSEYRVALDERARAELTHRATQALNDWHASWAMESPSPASRPRPR